jgi:hypothetical protein
MFLNIELSLNLNKDAGHGQFKECIALQKVYTVDTRILLEHRDKPFSVFNPIEAITSVAYTGRRTSRKRKIRRTHKSRKM